MSFQKGGDVFIGIHNQVPDMGWEYGYFPKNVALEIMERTLIWSDLQTRLLFVASGIGLSNWNFKRLDVLRCHTAFISIDRFCHILEYRPVPGGKGEEKGYCKGECTEFELKFGRRQRRKPCN